jgi:hypothetical protein
MKIISNRDKDGNFISSADAWPKEKIDELMNKFYPNRMKQLQEQNNKKENEEDEK